MNWQEDMTAGILPGEVCGVIHTEVWQITDSHNPSTQFRFTPGVGIDKSTDAGRTWHTEVDMTREQPRIDLQDKKYNNSYGQLQPGPLDALIDSRTHAVVVAMGQEGLLLGTPDGGWQWKAIGQYLRAQPASLYDFVSLFQTELWLGVVLALLIIGAFVWRIRRPNFRRPVTWLFGLVLVVGWAAWFFSAMLAEPATLNNYGYGRVILVDVPLWLAALIGVPVAIAVSLETLQTNRRALVVVLITAVASAVLYLVPLFIWAAGGIPRYSTASIYGGALILATLFAGDRYLRRALHGTRQPDRVSG